jgi:hypothetical protein
MTQSMAGSHRIGGVEGSICTKRGDSYFDSERGGGNFELGTSKRPVGFMETAAIWPQLLSRQKFTIQSYAQ